LVSLFVLEFFVISKRMKLFFGILLVLSILLTAIVNLSLVWWMLGIFSLFLFVYKVSFSVSGRQSEANKRVFPAIAFSVAMVSLLFIIAGQFLGGFLPNSLGVSNLEIRPSLASTMSVAKNVLSQDPILGAGPNRFTEMWDMYRPSVINATRFWDTSFNFGSGFLPTFFITTGSLGILSWVVLFFLLVVAGFKSLFTVQKKNVLNPKTNLFLFMSLYLFIASFVYSVGLALFVLVFAFLGIFIGLSCANKTKGEIVFSLLDDPRKSFFSILLLVAVMIATASAGFKYVERFASVFYYQNTVSAMSIPEAELSINKAISLYSNDFYFRTYSEVYIAKLNSLIAKGDSITDKEKAELQASFDQAVSGAQNAITYNPKNYLNFRILGLIYDTVAPLGVEGAYDNAITAYTNASNLNPLNPGIKINLARSSFSSGKMKEAKDYALQSLSLKRDNIDALIILSQLSKIEGNNNDALSYAQVALSLFPQNKDLAQYVDSLKNVPVVNTEASKNTTKKESSN